MDKKIIKKYFRHLGAPLNYSATETFPVRVTTTKLQQTNVKVWDAQTRLEVSLIVAAVVSEIEIIQQQSKN